MKHYIIYYRDAHGVARIDKIAGHATWFSVGEYIERQERDAKWSVTRVEYISSIL